MKKELVNKKQSFLSHLEALRWHLVRSCCAILIGTIIAFFWRNTEGEILAFEILFALKDFENFQTYAFLCYLTTDLWCFENGSAELINLKMTGQFLSHIFIAFVSGVIISFPYLLIEMWLFVSPALYKTEKIYSFLVFCTSFILFLIGVLFGYYLLGPVSVVFLLNYEAHGDIVNQIDFMSYISTVGRFVLGTAVMFQLPVLIYFLTKFGLVTPHQLRQYRRHAFVVILIAASVFTPPDMFSQVLIGLPIYILYEISIFVAMLTSRKK